MESHCPSIQVNPEFRPSRSRGNSLATPLSHSPFNDGQLPDILKGIADSILSDLLTSREAAPLGSPNSAGEMAHSFSLGETDIAVDFLWRVQGAICDVVLETWRINLFECVPDESPDIPPGARTSPLSRRVATLLRQVFGMAHSLPVYQLSLSIRDKAYCPSMIAHLTGTGTGTSGSAVAVDSHWSTSRLRLTRERERSAHTHTKSAVASFETINLDPLIVRTLSQACVVQVSCSYLTEASMFQEPSMRNVLFPQFAGTVCGGALGGLVRYNKRRVADLDVMAAWWHDGDGDEVLGVGIESEYNIQKKEKVTNAKEKNKDKDKDKDKGMVKVRAGEGEEEKEKEEDADACDWGIAPTAIWHVPSSIIISHSRSRGSSSSRNSNRSRSMSSDSTISGMFRVRAETDWTSHEKLLIPQFATETTSEAEETATPEESLKRAPLPLPLPELMLALEPAESQKNCERKYN